MGRVKDLNGFFNNNTYVEAGIANNHGIKLKGIDDPLLNATTEFNYIYDKCGRYVEPKIGLVATF